MNSSHRIRSAASWLGGGIALAAASYAVYVGLAWLRYGRAERPAGPETADTLLDHFIPAYEVSERDRVRVAAPTEITLAAARDMDLLQAPVARWIFKGRELIMGSRPDDRARPRELFPLVQSLGWGLLAEVPRRELPWLGRRLPRARRERICAASFGGIERHAQCFACARCQVMRCSRVALGGIGCLACQAASIRMSLPRVIARGVKPARSRA